MRDRQLLRKILLVFIIGATSAAPALFIQLDEPTFRLNLWKLLAKIGSLCGTALIFWQFLLGCRQAAARWATPDYRWVLKLHKRLGITIGALILLHPVFITPYYLEKNGLWVFSLSLPSPLDIFVPLGIAALTILLTIVITSTFLRRRMRQDAWYYTHLSSYVLLPLAFVHSYPIGMTLNRTGLRFVWQGLFVLTAVFYIWRVLARLGMFSSIYEVTRARHVAESVVDIAMRPVRRAFRPASAQFAFFRRCRSCGAKPFTISMFDRSSGELSITVKALGKVTSDLQSVQPGERFLVDGPYGVFGQEAFTTDRPVVMLAGGIGVTPFRRLIHELKRLPGRKAYLFYGNQYEKDIAHREEMEAAEHVDIIHVLSGIEEHEEFETGFISIALLKRYLGEDLSRYEFFLCGPPVMINKLEPSLRAENVPEEQIHHELFSY
ncbi:MAG: ferredoxin reductase family protein [Candidatus Latescibacterota bacterium]